MSEAHRRCSSSSSPRSPSPPSQTYYPSILTVPTPALVESAAGGAHYSGVKVDSEMLLKHRRNSSFKQHTDIKHYHQRILDDLTELYCCRPSQEIFERSWHRDAEFEVHSLSFPPESASYLAIIQDPLSKCKGYDEYAAQVSLTASRLQGLKLTTIHNPLAVVCYGPWILLFNLPQPKLPL
jgi:hypothetical protein